MKHDAPSSKHLSASTQSFEIFKAFALIGATNFGGGGSAHVQHHMVERLKWLSMDEYLECYSMVQTLPGPVFSNLCTHVGARLAGWRGGLLATIGVNFAGIIAILGIAVAYSSLDGKPIWLEGFLKGVAVAAVVISLAATIRVAPSAFRTRPSVFLALAAFIANALLHINILYVLLILIPIGMFLEWQEANRAI